MAPGGRVAGPAGRTGNAGAHPLFEVAHKALLIAGERLLMVRESASGLWELPGGRIDPGEEHAPAETILTRELAEELGPQFRWRLVRPVMTWTRVLPAGQRVFLVGWLCHSEGDAPELSDEHDAFAWIGDGEGVQPLAPGYDAVLHAFRRLVTAPRSPSASA
jgi:8-oxo-dGTP diphosphatase